jgi:hypothetical protein
VGQWRPVNRFVLGDQEPGERSIPAVRQTELACAWSCPDLADRFDCLNQLGALVSKSIGDT